MNFDEIKKALLEEYQSGKTYQEIADRSSISRQLVGSLITGERKIEKMSLETFFKLFPQATLNLNTTHGPNSPIINGSHNIVNAAPKESAESYYDRIVENKNIPDNIKVELYKLLKQGK